MSVPVLAVPDVACEPLHAPLASQLDALVDDQVMLELPPDATVVGVAEIVTVGAGATVVTDTVVDRSAEPPAPEQVRVNMLLALVSAPVLAVPDVERVPLQAPLAVQLVVSVDDQVRLELPPGATVVGVAEIDTVGAGVDVVTATVAD